MQCLFRHIAWLRKFGIVSVRYDSTIRAFAIVRYGAIQFAILLTSSFLGATYVLVRYSKDFIIYFDQRTFYLCVFIISKLTEQLLAGLNALLRNDTLLCTVLPSEKRYSYQCVIKFVQVVLWTSIGLALLFSLGYLRTSWVLSDEPLLSYLSAGFHILMSLYIDCTLSLCYLVILIAAKQLTNVEQRMLTIAQCTDETMCVKESVLSIICQLHDAITGTVLPSLTSYFGSTVTYLCPIVVWHCSIRLVNLLELLEDGHLVINGFDEMLASAMGLIWMVNDIKKLLIVLLLSDFLHRQVEETARCTRYFDDYRLQNTRAAKQVQKFLLKNLHQKKKFSACGFFDIDNTVIYMVFSSIVTYLVILIQFKQLENDLTQPVPYNGTANGTTEAP
uniref:Gustatory receptor n=1 Tax=Anopheles albimanus TaxID=7167 RepID=A0A1Y9G9D9_ANOAL